jgi:hypothetical protein
VEPLATPTVSEIDIEGLDRETAVERVCEAEPSVDPEHVRRLLEPVVADETVTRDAVDDALGHAAKVVATPETRVELTEQALADARETAAPVVDVTLVGHHLERFETRLATVRERVGGLGEELDDLTADADDLALYSLAWRLQRLTATAGEAQQAADQLTGDIEAFEEWVLAPEQRAEALAADCDALRESVDDVEAATADIEAADPDGETGAAWADTTLRQRLLAALVDDLRTEHEGLATLARHDATAGDADAAWIASIDADIETAETALEAIGDRLDAAATEDWEAAYETHVQTLELTIENLDPPMDWERAQQVFEQQRAAVAESVQ